MMARRSTSLISALSILTLPLCRRSWLTAGSTFSASSRGTFTRTVSPLPSLQITRTWSQRSPFSELVDCAALAWVLLACARTPAGANSRAGAIANMALVVSPRWKVDMADCLLAGCWQLGKSLGSLTPRFELRTRSALRLLDRGTRHPRKMFPSEQGYLVAVDEAFLPSPSC